MHCSSLQWKLQDPSLRYFVTDDRQRIMRIAKLCYVQSGNVQLKTEIDKQNYKSQQYKTANNLNVVKSEVDGSAQLFHRRQRLSMSGSVPHINQPLRDSQLRKYQTSSRIKDLT